MPPRITQEEFIAKARQVHGDRFDYSMTIYKTYAEKVTIICREHGVFRQIAGNHVYQKSGCPECKRVAISKSRKGKSQ